MPRSSMCPPAPCAQTKTLSVKEDGHADEVFVLAVLADRVAVDPFADETEALIEGHDACVGGAHAELDARQTPGPRSLERFAQERGADAPAAVRSGHREPQRAGMSARRAVERQHVAPADHLVGGERHECRMALADVVADKSPHLLERRRLEENEIAPLARHVVQRRPEACDVLLGDRNDAKVHGPTERRTSPPPWPWRAPPPLRGRVARRSFAAGRAAGAPPRPPPRPRD